MDAIDLLAMNVKIPCGLWKRRKNDSCRLKTEVVIEHEFEHEIERNIKIKSKVKYYLENMNFLSQSNRRLSKLSKKPISKSTKTVQSPLTTSPSSCPGRSRNME